MKILVLTNLYPPDFIGGYEIACAQVVDALRERGHDVRVLAAAPRVPVADPPHVERRFKLVEESNWYTTDLWFNPLGMTLRDVESRFINAYNVHAMTTYLDEFAPDVVYICNIIGLGGLALMACLQYLKVPWVWQLGDSVPRVLCSLPTGTFPALVDEFSRQITGHYIVVSSQLQRQIEEVGLRLGGQVDVIPNWIVGERPAPRTRYHRPGQPLRIMSAGQVSRHKGVDILIEAAGRLRDEGLTDFRVDIYGKVYDPYFAYLIRRLDLADLVTLKGVLPQKELMTRYGDYDVFAFPTQEREPFGLVPLEAAARGCVPIITRLGGIAEWLVHGVHCLKADRTPAAFAGAIASVIRGDIPLEPIGRRAEVTAWRDFHLDAILPKIERKLTLAARQSRSGAGTAAEAYRLARMAEQLTQVLIQESRVA